MDGKILERNKLEQILNNIESKAAIGTKEGPFFWTCTSMESFGPASPCAYTFVSPQLPAPQAQVETYLIGLMVIVRQGQRHTRG